MVNLRFAFITDVETLSSDGKPSIMCVPVQGHVSAGIYQNLLIRPQQSQLLACVDQSLLFSGAITRNYLVLS
jgi:hypothetical protein